ncbi:MAG: aminotransferase class V-fold PLP-dependent enzyme [Cyanobacteria bacterium J06634_5]
MALPKTAFVDPAGSNRTEIETLLHQAVALLVEVLAEAGNGSPLPTTLPIDQLERWAEIPRQSQDADLLLGEVRSHLTHSMNPAHPGYIGHMDSMPTVMSMVGDLLVAAINNNMLSVEMSPVFSRLEPLVMAQIAQQFGLGNKAGGVMVSGGSLANLQALTVARNIAFDALKTGVVGLSRKPVFFVSEVAHTSMQKAAMMMGLGSDAAIAIRTNANSQLDIADLNANIERARQTQQTPFAIVATAGTTVTGNIDPIVEIGAIAQSHNLWFHVDAAYGGALIFSPEYRHLLEGIEQADSVTFNPQKWLYVTKTCATVLFKDLDSLKSHFRILAPYMGDDDQWSNLGELSVQGTRHPDILKLWLSLQHLGTSGYAEIIRHNYNLTEQFTEAVKARHTLQLASQPQMNLICFRLAPKNVAAKQWDSLNAQLQHFLLRAKTPFFLSLPTYRQQSWLKAVLLNPYTCPQDIETLFQAIDTFITRHVTPSCPD